MRVLVIEDDTGIAHLIRQGLEEDGHTVYLAYDGTSGLAQAQQHAFQLIVLDVMLPGMDGWDVCASLREAKNTTPMLMLTARDAVADRVRGLEAGADDYLPKPFDFRELLARAHALLRRDKVHRALVIRVADLEIDTRQRRVRRAGSELTLSHREYELLEALAAQAGRILTREGIQERVWQSEETYSNTVNVYIGMLRKKVDAGHAVKLIHTIHGVGYVLRVPDRDAQA